MKTLQHASTQRPAASVSVAAGKRATAADASRPGVVAVPL